MDAEPGGMDRCQRSMQYPEYCLRPEIGRVGYVVCRGVAGLMKRMKVNLSGGSRIKGEGEKILMACADALGLLLSVRLDRSPVHLFHRHP